MKLGPILAEWIAHAEAHEVILYHLGELGAPDERTELASDRVGKADTDPAELARKYERVARTDAECRGAQQRYRIACYKRRGKALDSVAWMLDGGEQSSADPKSIVKEVQKQNRFLHKLVAELSQGTAGMLAKSYTEMADRFNHLQGQQQEQMVQQFSLTAQLFDRVADEKLERQKFEASEARKERMLLMAEAAVPRLLSHASGATMVRDLWAGLTEDQRTFLIDALKDDQVELIYQALREDQAATDGIAKVFHIFEGARQAVDAAKLGAVDADGKASDG